MRPRGESHLPPFEHRVEQVFEAVEDVEDDTKHGERLDGEAGVVERQILQKKDELLAGFGVADERPLHWLQRPGGDDRQPRGVPRLKPGGERGVVVEEAVGGARRVADAEGGQDVEELVGRDHD